MTSDRPLNLLIEAIQTALAPEIENLGSHPARISLGLRRSTHLPVLAAASRLIHKPILLITDRADRALALHEELSLWLPDTRILFFPEPTPLFYENATWGESTRRDRLSALTTLARLQIPGADRSGEAPILVTSVRALMTRSIPRREFIKSAVVLKTSQVIQLDELARKCLALGYESTSTVIASGQIARRGGILDIWSTAEDAPVRLEFFGDEIDTIRKFDPASQRTVQPNNGPSQDRILITPGREYLIGDGHADTNLPEEVSEFHIPVLHRDSTSILDYLPRGSVVLIDNQQALVDAFEEIEAQAVGSRAEQIKEQMLAPDFPIPYLTYNEISDALSMLPAIELSPDSGEISTEDEEIQSGVLGRLFTPGPRFLGRLKVFIDFLSERYAESEQVVIVSRQTARLKELWDEQRLREPDKQPYFLEGSLTEGWVFDTPTGSKLHLLTDGEIFGWRRPEPRRKARRFVEAPESSYSDLQVDDYVVHVDHGIGKFTGLVHRSVEGVEREYLCVEYADQAQLFVPVHQADRLTRYVGSDNRIPTLNRLGSNEWRTIKANVKEAVQEIAEDLLELYAKRFVIQGHSFSQDSAWQQELEASFPYIETDDQNRVLAEVKRDMEAPRPMDRLICGDVGYGKTEVALRAAFKSVMDGKQVAMLVPTTVLAQQHFNTFTQRLAAFPVNVEMLSRFRSPQNQREIIAELSQGKVDILIGTHRLLSADVEFKDMGLLIIDEEQRFGVTHKEQLKKMRTEVDVLTLTATPIPRTLYMALSGVRDISTINTPPEERLPIVTHVGPYSQRLVRQAILRELERGGQVFFVHNRVQTIGAMLVHLQQIVPEARIVVAHGQMDETELAKRMELFSDGEVDVLLSTSIIESGLDIPNANTLIVDRADTFGLAQLYQLRGRVGRGAQRAYAYFFRHKKRIPTLEGRQRLETIAENTQLGSGFSIAMRDLEIRGTGDILGTRQHGHIAAVGFHLYTSMLSQAVQRLRKQSGISAIPNIPGYNLQLIPVNVELPLDSAIPAAYVPEKRTRLGLYRRMAEMRSNEELSHLREEFIDRFGPIPEVVENLFRQLSIKILAEKAGLISISIENDQYALRFPDNIIPEDLPELGSEARIGKTAIWIAAANNGDRMKILVDTLIRLGSKSQPAGQEN